MLIPGDFDYAEVQNSSRSSGRALCNFVAPNTRISSFLTTPHLSCILSFFLKRVIPRQPLSYLLFAFSFQCWLLNHPPPSSFQASRARGPVQGVSACLWDTHSFRFQPHSPCLAPMPTILLCSPDRVQTSASHRLNTMLLLHKHCAWEPEPPIILL